MLRTAFALALAVLSSACAQLPRAELQAYRDAFAAAQTAAEPILTDYAVAERAARANRLEHRADFARTGFFAVFDPAEASAVSSISLPAGASALRRGFQGIGNYNDTLVALAENRNIDEARAQVQQTITSLTGAVSAFAPEAAVAETPIQTVVGAVARLLEPAIAAENRAQFNRIVLDGYPKVRELIGILRDFTPAQYSLTTRTLRERWVRQEANRPAIAAEINAWHRVFGDYVALLNALERNLTALHAAVERPRAMPLLVRASTGAAELRGYAEMLRRSIDEIRAAR